MPKKSKSPPHGGVPKRRQRAQAPTASRASADGEPSVVRRLTKGSRAVAVAVAVAATASRTRAAAVAVAVAVAATATRARA